MKKLLALTFVLLLSATAIFAQHKTPTNRASPHETISGNNMKVTYGRPYKKGRVIFGDGKTSLETYGKVWRTGADEATEITLEKDCKFAGKPVKAGTYVLFTIPGKNEWGIILNGQLNQWGAFSYDKNKDKDVLHVTVPAKHLNTPVEQFTITIDKSGFKMEWDDASVYVPVKF
jgi:DUF2911 family protein